MGYYVDLGGISIDGFKDMLVHAYLLPSQKVLLEDIDVRFDIIKECSIGNIFELQQKLKTKKKVGVFAKESSISFDYLFVLRRMINSLHPKPRALKDFECLRSYIIKALDDMGIKTTLDLYDRVASKKERKKLQQSINISDDGALLLAKLVDVSRLRYVNQPFATLLVNSDFDTVEKISAADAQEILKNLLVVNETKKFFGGKFGQRDMDFMVNDAKGLSLDIEY